MCCHAMFVVVARNVMTLSPPASICRRAAWSKHPRRRRGHHHVQCRSTYELTCWWSSISSPGSPTRRLESEGTKRRTRPGNVDASTKMRLGSFPTRAEAPSDRAGRLGSPPRSPWPRRKATRLHAQCRPPAREPSGRRGALPPPTNAAAAAEMLGRGGSRACAGRGGRAHDICACAGAASSRARTRREGEGSRGRRPEPGGRGEAGVGPTGRSGSARMPIHVRSF